MARRAEEEDAVAESRSLLRGDAAAQASRARFGKSQCRGGESMRVCSLVRVFSRCLKP
jgi:hypothetical protein